MTGGCKSLEGVGMTPVPRSCVVRETLNAEGKGVTYMMSTLSVEQRGHKLRL